MQPVFIGIVPPDSFCCLQQMLYLRLVKVWITLIHILVQELTAFPDAHKSSIKLTVLFTLSNSLHIINKSNIRKVIQLSNWHSLSDNKRKQTFNCTANALSDHTRPDKMKKNRDNHTWIWWCTFLLPRKEKSYLLNFIKI